MTHLEGLCKRSNTRRSGDGKCKAIGSHNSDFTETTHSDCQGPVYPPIIDALGDEPEYERSQWHSQRNEQRPDAHVTSSFFPEESLLDNATTDSRRWTDEECGDSSAQCHGCIGWALRGSNIANYAAYEGHKEDRSTAIALRYWLPE